jgi:hypothetical protein
MNDLKFTTAGEYMSDYPKQTGPNSWIVEVQENGKTKELFIEFPPGAIDQVGWDIGDELVWNELDDGSWSVTKKIDEIEKKDV